MDLKWGSRTKRTRISTEGRKGDSLGTDGRVETLPKGATLDTTSPIEEFASFQSQGRNKCLGSKAVVGALRALQWKSRELQGENEALKGEIKALRRKLEEARDREKEEDVNRSVARERELREQLDTLEGKYRRKSGRKEAESENLTAILTALKLQLATLSAEHQATLEDNSVLREKCSRYEGEIRLMSSRGKVALVSVQSSNQLFSKLRKIRVTSAIERPEIGAGGKETVQRKSMEKRPQGLYESVDASHLLAVSSTPLLFRPTAPSRLHPRVLIPSLAASPSHHSTSTTL